VLLQLGRARSARHRGALEITFVWVPLLPAFVFVEGPRTLADWVGGFVPLLPSFLSSPRCRSPLPNLAQDPLFDLRPIVIVRAACAAQLLWATGWDILTPPVSLSCPPQLGAIFSPG